MTSLTPEEEAKWTANTGLQKFDPVQPIPVATADFLTEWFGSTQMELSQDKVMKLYNDSIVFMRQQSWSGLTDNMEVEYVDWRRGAESSAHIYYLVRVTIRTTMDRVGWPTEHISLNNWLVNKINLIDLISDEFAAICNDRKINKFIKETFDREYGRVNLCRFPLEKIFSQEIIQSNCTAVCYNVIERRSGQAQFYFS